MTVLRAVLVDNASDASQVKDAKRVVKRALWQADEDLRDVANTPSGERFLARQIAGAGVFHTSFSSDPLLMARDEGRRNEGLKLLAQLVTVNPTVAARILTASHTAETPV